ncbi:MAG: DinB family protein [Sphingobacteriaceae bacterium]|nr:DinB family protein [Sphingobacteriaceae bacterium]MBK7819059.1 DinB family protein [Sphingobacteriaceae bacterium]
MTGHIIKNLVEIKDLLKGLSQEQYSRKLEIMTDASIGQHVRHILEFYQCLFKGEENKEVNYDARQRDLKLETDIHFTTKTIDNIVNALLEVKSDFPVTFIADYSTSEGQKPVQIQSSFYRELAYNLEHSVHHQALIKVAITEMQLTALVKDTFGYAPSTIRHLNKICAQ